MLFSFTTEYINIPARRKMDNKGADWKPRNDKKVEANRPRDEATTSNGSARTGWIQTAQDRKEWKKLREAYVQYRGCVMMMMIQNSYKKIKIF